VRRVASLVTGVLLPVGAGGLVYLLLRSRSLVMFRWADALGVGDGLDAVRNHTRSLAVRVPDVLLYSLPDGLWAFAYARLCMWLWNDRPLRPAIAWALALPAVALVAELGQAAGWVPGTFDGWDLLCYGAGGAAPVLWCVHTNEGR